MFMCNVNCWIERHPGTQISTKSSRSIKFIQIILMLEIVKTMSYKDLTVVFSKIANLPSTILYFDFLLLHLTRHMLRVSRLAGWVSYQSCPAEAISINNIKIQTLKAKPAIWLYNWNILRIKFLHYLYLMSNWQKISFHTVIEVVSSNINVITNYWNFCHFFCVDIKLPSTCYVMRVAFSTRKIRRRKSPRIHGIQVDTLNSSIRTGHFLIKAVKKIKSFC